MIVIEPSHSVHKLELWHSKHPVGHCSHCKLEKKVLGGHGPAKQVESMLFSIAVPGHETQSDEVGPEHSAHSDAHSTQPVPAS